jgi:K+-sensing histidine kinase KdpD
MARAIPDHTPGRLTYYALAVLLSGLALALTLLLEPLMERSIFLLFIAAIVVSALYGGLGPGLVAVFLSTSASGLFFVPPLYTCWWAWSTWCVSGCSFWL